MGNVGYKKANLRCTRRNVTLDLYNLFLVVGRSRAYTSIPRYWSYGNHICRIQNTAICSSCADSLARFTLEFHNNIVTLSAQLASVFYGIPDRRGRHREERKYESETVTLPARSYSWFALPSIPHNNGMRDSQRDERPAPKLSALFHRWQQACTMPQTTAEKAVVWDLEGHKLP